ncbi:MAG: lipopolysaccharide biosynthesis protein [Muribaculum sp.]|nr:lipopolysaccharide biosynthesis protein [Muribaculum sp.]
MTEVDNRMDNVKDKAIKASRWSLMAELTSKLVQPISTMVLARLLTPEAFGIMVTATMVLSFTELFTDAGFNKYIVQHDFEDEGALKKGISVAFWSNMVTSIFAWLLIVIFSPEIAEYVGSAGYGNCIAVSAACIPLAAFSSIQMAMYNRELDYKTLYYLRLIGVAIPIIITIPIAFITRSYWTLIVGMLSSHVVNAIVLFLKSKWKITWFYDFKIFKSMFSFTFWSMVESVINWMTKYMDLFIVGKLLSDYYLGLYKTSMGTVAQITSLITASTSAILFSSLSRYQNDNEQLRHYFLKFIRAISIILVPLGMGIFLYQDLIENILLGAQWREAAYFIGLWGLRDTITIIFAHYVMIIFRAKGKPYLTAVVQGVYVLSIIPVVYYAIPYGFDTLSNCRALVSIVLVIASMIVVYHLVRLSWLKILKNVYYPMICSGLMALISYFILPKTDNYYIQFTYVLICAVVYITALCIHPKYKTDVNYLFKMIRKR